MNDHVSHKATTSETNAAWNCVGLVRSAPTVDVPSRLPANLLKHNETELHGTGVHGKS